MWVSREEFEELKAKVSELENLRSEPVIYEDLDRSFYRYRFGGYVPPEPSIPVSQAVRMILRHLGLELKFTEAKSVEPFLSQKEEQKPDPKAQKCRK